LKPVVNERFFLFLVTTAEQVIMYLHCALAAEEKEREKKIFFVFNSPQLCTRLAINIAKRRKK
jgi:hypothetical protein